MGATLALSLGVTGTIGGMRILLSLLVLTLLGCPPNPPAPPPGPDADAAGPSAEDASVPPAPAVDAAPAPAADATPTPLIDACGAAEVNLLKLGCKDGRGYVIGSPNLHGVPWAQICRDNKAHGVDMKPACIALAKDCTGVMSCR